MGEDVTKVVWDSLPPAIERALGTRGRSGKSSNMPSNKETRASCA